MPTVLYQHVPGDKVFVVYEPDRAILNATVLRVRIVEYLDVDDVVKTLIQYVVELSDNTSRTITPGSIFNNAADAINYLDSLIVTTLTATPTPTQTPTPSVTSSITPTPTPTPTPSNSPT